MPFNLGITQLGPPSSAKLLSRGETIEYWWVYLWWFTANDVGKTIGANLSFLTWFGLINDAYVHRYPHWWDHGLHIQSGVNLSMLWAQLSIYEVNRSRCELFIGFLLSKLESKLMISLISGFNNSFSQASSLFLYEGGSYPKVFFFSFFFLGSLSFHLLFIGVLRGDSSILW